VSSWCLNLVAALRQMFQARWAQLFGWPIARPPRRHAASVHATARPATQCQHRLFSLSSAVSEATPTACP